MRLSVAAPLAALLALGLTPAAAQQPASPEQRIQRLERQLEQMQRRVFPRGRPADTAGFADDPAATQSSVANLSERLNSLERQLAEILRQTEENGNRLATVERDFGRAREDQDRRLRELETFVASAGTQLQPQPAVTQPTPGTPNAAARPPAATTAAPSTNGPGLAASDPGEDAYSEGFRLWQSGQYDQAITALRAFTSAFPKHRRVSWANNLAGRAMLDKGQPRAAAEALLANYRANPSGERAPDSLYYLGQALLKLGQPAQACNAYEELEDVYGAKLRDDLKRLLPAAKTEAQCR